MRLLIRFLLVLASLGLAACDSTDFTSTWHDPAIYDVDWGGEVAVFLLTGNESARRSFESNLADQLNQRNVEAVPGYELLPETDPTDKAEILADLQRSEADYTIFMRIIDQEQEVSYVPGTSWYPDPYYDPFYWYGGSYYGPGGFGGPWPPYYDPGYFRVDTIVSVETLMYSVPDSELLWAGMSRTMNPSEVDDFVEELVGETVDELKDLGIERFESGRNESRPSPELEATARRE